MNQQIENEILQELRRISKILILMGNQNKSQREQIENLSNIGFLPKEIADLLGTTRNTVNVALVGIRKKKGKEKNTTGKAKAKDVIE